MKAVTRESVIQRPTKKDLSDGEKEFLLYLLCEDIRLENKTIYDVRRRYCLAIKLAYDLNAVKWLKCLLEFDTEEQLDTSKYFEDFFLEYNIHSTDFDEKHISTWSDTFNLYFNLYISCKKELRKAFSQQKKVVEYSGPDSFEEEITSVRGSFWDDDDRPF